MAYGNKSSEADEVLRHMKGETAPSEDEDKPMKSGGVDAEAKIAAAEDILTALHKTKDAAALSEALEAHYAACGG
jgi:hypothetical protein